MILVSGVIPSNWMDLQIKMHNSQYFGTSHNCAHESVRKSFVPMEKKNLPEYLLLLLLLPGILEGGGKSVELRLEL